MIDKTEAKKQVARFAGLDFFPREAEAASELIAAMQAAETLEIAKAFTGDWVSRQTAVPKPAEIRAGLYDLAQEIRDRRSRCGSCGGSGSVVQFWLVTYRDRGFEIDRKERMSIATEEQAQELRRQLAQHGNVAQDVLSVAAPCPACAKGVAA